MSPNTERFNEQIGMVLDVRFESWYITLPSSTKQQREMTKSYVFWRTPTEITNFSYLLLKLETPSVSCLA